MKLLPVVLLLMTVSVTAQRYTDKKQKNIVFANKLEIGTPSIKSLLTPALAMKHIEVIDNRFDSTVWGFLKSYGSLKAIISKGNQPVSKILQTYLSKKISLDSTTNKSLLIVIQQLQFTQNYKTTEKVTHFKSDKTFWLAALTMKIEFYLKENQGYSPLYRFDSTIISNEPIAENETLDFIFDNLHLSLNKLTRSEFSFFKSTQIVQLNQITENNNRKFDIPILHDTFYRKGAYRTYEEFKKNTPSITNFEIKTDGRTNTLIVTENGQEYPIRKIWGFCDGDNVYVQSNFNYFQLARKENTYFTLAAKEYEKKVKLNAGKFFLSTAMIFVFPIPSSPLDDRFNVSEINRYGLSLHAYILNMETGHLY